MNINPILRINLDQQDLRQIRDMALDAIKNTSNMAIDSDLHPVSCIVQAFVDLVNKSDSYILLKQPGKQPYQVLDED